MGIGSSDIPGRGSHGDLSEGLSGVVRQAGSLRGGRRARPNLLLHAVLPIVAGLFFVGCGEQDGPPAGDEAIPPGAQARSFLGQALFAPPLDPDLRASREADLEMARADLEADPEDPEAWIWVGRREAYLGEYRDAIDTFTRGLERFPEDARFLRHRGHRYLTVREPNRAQADLEAGLTLAAEEPDQVEPDGLPNVLGVPLTTLQFNLWYHLALAHYVQGDFEGAVRAWESCMEVSTNPDLEVATGYWLYLSRMRLEREEETAGLLEGLPESDELIENETYLQLLRLYAGQVSPEELLQAEEAGTLGGATLRYGVAMHHLLAGDEVEARAQFQEILDEPDQWAAFGYMAAEAEVARRGW